MLGRRELGGSILEEVGCAEPPSCLATDICSQKTALLQGCIAKCGDAALFGDRHLRLLESIDSTVMPSRDRHLLWFVLWKGTSTISTMIQFFIAQHRCLLQLLPCSCQSLTFLCIFPPRLLGSSRSLRPRRHGVVSVQLILQHAGVRCDWLRESWHSHNFAWQELILAEHIRESAHVVKVWNCPAVQEHSACLIAIPSLVVFEDAGTLKPCASCASESSLDSLLEELHGSGCSAC